MSRPGKYVMHSYPCERDCGLYQNTRRATSIIWIQYMIMIVGRMSLDLDSKH